MDMDKKSKNLPPTPNNQSSLVSMILVIAILGLLATIIIRALTPAVSDADITNEQPTTVHDESIDAGRAPVISRVVLREEWRDDELLVYQDIYFSDVDGDASRVDFTLIETTAENVYIDDGIISARPEVQRTGTLHTATWTCHSGAHTVTLQVELVDQNDQHSAAHLFTITCRNTQR
jgi:hypothetical protein